MAGCQLEVWLISFAICCIFSFTMVLSSPVFLNFLDSEVQEETKQNYTCVLPPEPADRVDSCTLNNQVGWYKSKVICFQFYFCTWSPQHNMWLMYRYECDLGPDGRPQEFDETLGACTPGGADGTSTTTTSTTTTSTTTTPSTTTSSTTTTTAISTTPEEVGPSTEVPATPEPPTPSQPITSEPTTQTITPNPTTQESTSQNPTTQEVTTQHETTIETSTPDPTTPNPTTVELTTQGSTTPEPTTVEPTTICLPVDPACDGVPTERYHQLKT